MPAADTPTPTPPSPPPPSRRRLRLSVGAAVVLGIVVLSAAVGLGLLRGRAAPDAAVPWTERSAPATAGAAVGELYVHVLGAVGNPGLYVLHSDARVVDAIAAAGGTSDTADLAAVNLARRLEDGEQLVVPAVGAAAAATSVETDPRIDLNSADESMLDTLPRIGPALAARIVAWRDENGPFRAVDDLLAVPGIGEKLLAGLRDAVRV